jgi:hypothetical protein
MKKLTDSRVNYAERLFRVRNGQDRALIAEIGVALAEADGYVFALKDFEWMSWTSMQMACDGQTVQRRAVWYAEKARSILPIVKRAIKAQPTMRAIS